ncbi:chromate transporter-domain-containing protein [Hysterangium stoloniferum]|nr:chromate transporter-domain-containing protein [Hysterangium stoloniferum]
MSESALNHTYPRQSLTARCVEVARLFGPFGFIAFGGPAANIVMLRKIFVVREKWLDDKTFTDLFALSSALPGPAFSQLAFAISLLRGGYIPAVLSFILLTGPGALAMLGFGFGVRHIPDTLPDVVFALFSGLNAAAVGLITVAAYDLSAKVITDPLTRIAVLLSAAFAICYESQWLYPVLMVAGGLSTLGWDYAMRWRQKKLTSKSPNGPEMAPREEPLPSQDATRPNEIEKQEQRASQAPDLPARDTSPSPMDEGAEHSQYFTLSVRVGLLITAVYIAFFVIMIILRATTLHQRVFQFFVNILIAGTIIFGGGAVVIPLLRTYTVEPGWVNPRDFILGFALIQALPGPFFNFAIFLGVLALPHQPVVGAILGCVAIFLPGIVLKVGLLPLYTRWKSSQTAQSVLRGLNATAVGLIFAAVYRLLRVGFISASHDPNVLVVYTSLDQDGWWVVITATTFVACEWFNLPAPVAIAGGAIGGIAWWGVNKS